MVPERLTEEELQARLPALPSWRREGETIHSSWRFPDFAAAFGFMTEVAIHGDKRNHHPEWSNVYNRVSIVLTTHDAGGLTAYDLEMAEIIVTAATRAGGESTTDSSS